MKEPIALSVTYTFDLRCFMNTGPAHCNIGMSIRMQSIINAHRETFLAQCTQVNVNIIKSVNIIIGTESFTKVVSSYRNICWLIILLHIT